MAKFSMNGGEDAIAVTILLVGAGAGTFASFCPSWFTVRSPFFHEQAAKSGNIQAIRQGEAVGTLITMVEGIAASLLIHSWLPTIGAAIISAVMIAGYEYSIANPATEVEPEDADMMKLSGWRYGAA